MAGGRKALKLSPVGDFPVQAILRACCFELGLWWDVSL
jgi:hypothetical protein